MFWLRILWAFRLISCFLRETGGEQACSIDLAKTAVGEQRSQYSLSGLRALMKQAEDRGLKYEAIKCSVLLGEALIQVRDYARARQELESGLEQSEKLGLQPLSVEAHYLLATSLRGAGEKAQAQEHYLAVLGVLDNMQKESGAEKLLQRSDLAVMYKDSSHWSQGQS